MRTIFGKHGRYVPNIRYQVRGILGTDSWALDSWAPGPQIPNLKQKENFIENINFTFHNIKETIPLG